MIRAITATETGEYVIAESVDGACIELDSFIITIAQGQGPQTGAKLLFRDENKSMDIFKAYTGNKPVEYGLTCMGWKSWPGAWLELQVIGNAKTFLSVRYERIIKEEGGEYNEG